MINLKNDYCNICHKEVLEALQNNLSNNFNGYGLDEHSGQAKKIILKMIENDDADVHFLTGGTATNKILISHVLRPYEAVICADSGHISVHETGAIEGEGHKVLTVQNHQGKIIPEDIVKICGCHMDEHMVKPRMVYISNSTEYGTVYCHQELKEISQVCHKLGLYLYLDGARLGVALTSDLNDLSLKMISELVDAFYIGGTKNGLLLGEALVVVNKELQKDFRYSIKHFGGMYAKGFVNGIQFETLLKGEENALFYRIGKKENTLAKRLIQGLERLNVKFKIKAETNQLFPIFKNNVVEKLSKHIMFELWENLGEESVIRFVTHFSLNDEDIDQVLDIIKENI